MNPWLNSVISINYAICESCSVGCEAHEPNVTKAVIAAKQLGWKRVGDSVLCPDCQPKKEAQ